MIKTCVICGKEFESCHFDRMYCSTKCKGKQSYLNNKKKYIERAKIYGQNNPEIIKESKRKYYRNNKEKVKEISKKCFIKKRIEYNKTANKKVVELRDTYVKDILKNHYKFIEITPELIKQYREILQMKRLFKKIKQTELLNI